MVVDLVEAAVEGRGAFQLMVSADRGDPAVIEQDDPVCELDRPQAVGDEEGGAAPGELFDRLANRASS